MSKKSDCIVFTLQAGDNYNEEKNNFSISIVDVILFLYKLCSD